MWSANNSRKAGTSTKNHAKWRWSERATSMNRRISAHREEGKTNERSGTRPYDAWIDRHRDHDGLPHRLHADGDGNCFRLHRVLPARRAVLRQPHLRFDGAALVWRHD